MSRKGKQPIAIPKGVEVTVSGRIVKVKGPKGELTQEVRENVVVTKENDEIVLSVKGGDVERTNFLGLYQALITNMIVGTTEGFTKSLEMIGVGYRAVVQGDKLDLQIGLSHPCKLPIPRGVQVKVDKNIINISGADSREIGQFAAVIRSKRPPQPYNEGKGIRYVGEYVRKKAGKTAAKK